MWGWIALGAFFGVWIGWAIYARRRNWSGTISIGGGFFIACSLVAVVGAFFGLASKIESAKTEAQPAPKLEADPVKRGVIAMDAIYASEGAFGQHGMPVIETIVSELQSALAMWPEAGNGEGVDACRMALKLQTTYMLNVMDRLGVPADARTSDFRQTCRDAVSYQHDDARIHQVWDALVVR